MIDGALVNMVAKDYLPFLVVEHAGFKDYLVGRNVGSNLLSSIPPDIK